VKIGGSFVKGVLCKLFPAKKESLVSCRCRLPSEKSGGSSDIHP